MQQLAILISGHFVFSFVCFDLMLERIPFVCNDKSLCAGVLLKQQYMLLVG